MLLEEKLYSLFLLLVLEAFQNLSKFRNCLKRHTIGTPGTNQCIDAIQDIHFSSAAQSSALLASNSNFEAK